MSPVVDHRARSRLDRLAAGWCLVVLACLLSAPGAARAGCDYLHDFSASEGRPGAPGHFDLLQQYGALRGVAPDVPTFPQPCSGPSCSRGPLAPDVPLQPGAPPGVGRWGCLALASRPVRGVRSYRRARELRVEPITGGPSVFHPPRPAASA